MPTKNPVLKAAKNLRWKNKNREHARRYQREWRKKHRLIAIEHYGGKCVCCGERQLEFLGFDHIDGGGSKERKQTKLSGSDFGRKLKTLGWPTDIRLLCHNCNLSRGFYGYCPHGTGNPSETNSKLTWS